MDLHGFFYVNDAIRAVEEFIERFIREISWQKVLIITGRGSHSPNGCVIKPVVIKWLDERGFRISWISTGFFYVNDAIRAVEEFIERFIREISWQKVLIITGRGSHSPNGCVIKPVVIKWLDERGFR
ncbi:hypothetical protein HOLleu_03035 [Holothuria leucospilota]|uniref:Smr domain-containing protein n=1 Tax=Holothuria leucospilota TaxID=206669 RepID=A0A9Q1CSZ4_HOLLE|nr:hypothetical protein HOLleu_03035 [Holothuria leucospilota]